MNGNVLIKEGGKVTDGFLPCLIRIVISLLEWQGNELGVVEFKQRGNKLKLLNHLYPIVFFFISISK